MERKAIHELNSKNNIIIKPADKGSACVVMNTSDYKTEAINQLSNNKYYNKVNLDLTGKKHRKEVKRDSECS